LSSLFSFCINASVTHFTKVDFWPVPTRAHGEAVRGSNPFRSIKIPAQCAKLVAGVVRMSPADKQIVANMTGVLVQAAHPKRIILFGSQAKGNAAEHSDFDIMVVEEKPGNRFAEMVRLNRLIRSFDIAVDLLVVSDEKFQYWRDTPGNIYYEAATGGQVLYQAA
jgi:predicted nucleotidyltransferase